MRPRIRWSGRDIFTWRLGGDGKTFRRSETFVARFVKRELRWSKTNEGTQAGKGFLRTLWDNFVSRLTSAITQSPLAAVSTPTRLGAPTLSLAYQPIVQLGNSGLGRWKRG